MAKYGEAASASFGVKITVFKSIEALCKSNNRVTPYSRGLNFSFSVKNHQQGHKYH